MKNGWPLTSAATADCFVSGARWMVVDDDKDVREFLANALERIGSAAVSRFSSAREALDAFNSSPKDFQFVVTDLEMPGMNGIELCQQLHAVAPDVKVVLATGSADLNASEAHEKGFCALLTKPFALTAVWQALAAAGLGSVQRVGHTIGANFPRHCAERSAS